MISTKDLSYIEDIFNWNFTMCKKALLYSSLVEDDKISDYFAKVAEEHENFCTKLIKKLG